MLGLSEAPRRCQGSGPASPALRPWRRRGLPIRSSLGLQRVPLTPDPRIVGDTRLREDTHGGDASHTVFLGHPSARRYSLYSWPGTVAGTSRSNFCADLSGMLSGALTGAVFSCTRSGMIGMGRHVARLRIPARPNEKPKLRPSVDFMLEPLPAAGSGMHSPCASIPVPSKVPRRRPKRCA